MANFKDLPAELRVMIFDYLFPSTTNTVLLIPIARAGGSVMSNKTHAERSLAGTRIQRRTRSYADEMFICRSPNDERASVQVLFVCRLWYQEALPIFQESMTWRLTTRRTIETYINIPDTAINVPNTFNIPRVESWTVEGVLLLRDKIGMNHLHNITRLELDLFQFLIDLVNNRKIPVHAARDADFHVAYAMRIGQGIINPMAEAFKIGFTGLRSLEISHENLAISTRANSYLSREKVRDCLDVMWMESMLRDTVAYWIRNIKGLDEVVVRDFPQTSQYNMNMFNEEFREFLEPLLVEKKKVTEQLELKRRS